LDRAPRRLPGTTARGHFAGEARALGADLGAAMDKVGFPAFLIDGNGRIKALNDAAREFLGDQRGRLATSVVAAEDVDEVKRHIARKLLKPGSTDYVVTLRDALGRGHRTEITSVSVVNGEGHVVGIFGLANVLDTQPAREHPDYDLTPRQREILAQLVNGHSTEQIALSLGIAQHTVRNHIRGILRALGVHSRIEAVAVAVRERPAAN
jgi:DNA-binding CsgD family transcriptional regulator